MFNATNYKLHEEAQPENLKESIAEYIRLRGLESYDYKWAAVDFDGELYLFENKPIYSDVVGVWHGGGGETRYVGDVEFTGSDEDSLMELE